MNIKRDMGICKIFLLSCGIIAVGAGVLQLAAGIGSAVDIAAEQKIYGGSVYSMGISDAFTPWLMLAAGMITYTDFGEYAPQTAFHPRSKQSVLQ